MEKFKILFFVFSFLLLIFPLSAFSQLKNKPLSQKNVSKWDADLVIVGGTVVTMDKDRRVIEDGAVAVKNGEVMLVGKRAAVTKNLRAKQTINADGKIIIPGLINTHTHVPMSLFRGIADDLDLQEWLTKYIFPAEAKNVTEDFVRAGTQLGIAEMIRGGTTTYCDMYYFEDAVADETFKAGMRGVLGETIIDFPVADNKTPEEALVYAEKFINKWKNNLLITPALAPHAPYTVSTAHLKAVRALSDKTNAPVVIHVAETKKEVDDITKQYGDSPVDYLAKIGFLNNRTIAAHVVHVTDEEMDLLKRLGVGVAHNPQSNMKLASGVAPIPQMLLKDIPVGLGTDGAASNNDLSMWEEMDTAAKLHKVFSGDPKVVSAEEAFEMATLRGARALHLENFIGSIEAGKRADIVLVASNDLNQTPFYNIYSSLVYATKANDVETVIIDGKVIMRDRRLLTLDENVIKKNANLYRQKIIKSLSGN
ncbi:MAG TPA: amidohydrolase [Pyrinomonadaceae bacterium]|jgi:5-methylthioadenosine/S-adenosylhomocysteine deaminase